MHDIITQLHTLWAMSKYVGLGGNGNIEKTDNRVLSVKWHECCRLSISSCAAENLGTVYSVAGKSITVSVIHKKKKTKSWKLCSCLCTCWPVRFLLCIEDILIKSSVAIGAVLSFVPKHYAYSALV